MVLNSLRPPERENEQDETCGNDNVRGNTTDTQISLSQQNAEQEKRRHVEKPVQFKEIRHHKKRSRGGKQERESQNPDPAHKPEEKTCYHCDSHQYIQKPVDAKWLHRYQKQCAQ